MPSIFKDFEKVVFIAFFCTLIAILIIRALIGSSGHASILNGSLLALSVVFLTLIISKSRVSLACSFLFVIAFTLSNIFGAWISPKYLVFLPISTALYFSFAFIEILKKIFSSQSNNFNIVVGSVSAYILIGFIFGLAFIVIDTLTSNSFFFSNGAKENDLMYFSFVTLTTLGFGDISPLTPLTKTLTIMEAIFGQIYLIVVISRIIGMQTTSQVKP